MEEVRISDCGEDLEPLLRGRAEDQDASEDLLEAAKNLREGLEELVEQDAQEEASY